MHSIAPLAMLTMGEKYLQSASNFSQLFLREFVPAHKRKAHWDEEPKIEQFDSAIPCLFLYFHGIELTLKGHLLGQGIPCSGHDLMKLLAKMPRKKANQTLKAHIRESLKVGRGSPLDRFLRKNRVGLMEWYETLKYPSTKKKPNHTLMHFDFKYPFLKGAKPFWERMSKNAKKLIIKSVTLAKCLGYA
jgi:hypothetical protein